MANVLIDSGRTIHIANSIEFNDDLSLPKTMNRFARLLILPRHNSINRFGLVDASQPIF